MAKYNEKKNIAYLAKKDFALTQCNRCGERKPVEFIYEEILHGFHVESLCCRDCYDELPD